MFALVLSIAAMAAKSPAWYGPIKVEFSVPMEEGANPFDPDQMNVVVHFHDAAMRDTPRIAYWDGTRWDAYLVCHERGPFTYTVTDNGKTVVRNPIRMKLARMPGHGFIRLGGPLGFEFDDGTPYWPLGHDLAWSDNVVPSLPTELLRMGADGANWARIWATQWDGKNPFWRKDSSKTPYDLRLGAFKIWDSILNAATTAKVEVQWTLFYHGAFSSTVNTNWPSLPWNVQNGGFLKTPADFFTSRRAKHLTKEYLRYVVARYGHFPAIMSWELFNEVQWTDGIKDGHPEIVAAWHQEMADYLRSIDPYHHLITTSSDLSLPIYSSVDYYQPHAYVPNIAATILYSSVPKDKPLFYGEIGPTSLGGGASLQRKTIRDGIWSAVFARQAGAGEFWDWDTIRRDSLDGEYVLASKILRRTGVVASGGWTMGDIGVQSQTGAPLRMGPGVGWAPTTVFEVKLPQDAQSAMGHFSSYFQGNSHRSWEPKPIRLEFDAPATGSFSATILGASSSGGTFQIWLDGVAQTDAVVASGDGPKKFVLSYPPGAHVITLWNDGSDWIGLRRLSFSNIGSLVSGVGIGKPGEAVVRLTRASGIVPGHLTPVTISGLPIEDGHVQITLFDLNHDQSEQVFAIVSGGQVVIPLSRGLTDCIAWIQKR